MNYMIGIDEVGRGSLAGPVVVCAAAIPVGWRPALAAAMMPHSKEKKIALRNSKRLSSRQREAWYAYLTNHPRVRYALARVYPRVIEKENISRAANTAALRAFRRLMPTLNVSRSAFRVSRVFLDGGLFLGNGRQFAGAKTVVKGDEKFTSIKIASIIAKVSRDYLMVRLGKKYPVYGFEIHKGYGTKAHLAAIAKHGPSEVHRLTFIGRYNSIKQ